jgi:hydroxymethylpyrimidine/phosphomethylpyrimidine kinase
MLYSAELIEAVAAALKKHNAQKIVLDPVMVAQSGDKLLQDDAIEAIKTHLMPLADVVTPNIPEASVLFGRPIKQWSDIESAADFVSLAADRIETNNNHGTGCTLSSAIASYMARGKDIEAAVQKAKTFMNQAIAAGAAYKLGHGHGPVHHFFQWWE